jgi:CelD/BcsL family acetyltransferase involved in cellulose biosynthesis
MPQSNVTLRPSELPTEGAASHLARPQHAGHADMASDELELPLSASPPLSVAAARPAERLSGSGVSLRVHSDLNEVAEEWRAFERHADHTVFQSFDWLAAWQRHIGAPCGTIPAIVLGRDADGELLFILQLAVETSGSARRLTWLGSALCDYNAPLLARHFSDHMSAERFVLAWRDVVKLLQSRPRLRFDLIDLQKMPEAVGEQRNPFLDLQSFNFQILPHPSGAYVANLGRDWEQFYAAKRSSRHARRSASS